MVTPKPKRKSRMLWLNKVLGVAAAFALLGDWFNIARQTGVDLSFIPDWFATAIVLLGAISNHELRKRTTQPVE